MFKKIAGTVVTRVLVAALTFLVVVLNTHHLGPERVGTISLIVLAITIVQMINNFIGGASLTYFVPRAALVRLFVPAVVWAFLTSGIVVVVLHAAGAIPPGFAWHVMALSFLLSLSSVATMILLGQERIRAINTVILAQYAMLALSLAILYLVAGFLDILSYLVGLYISYGVSAVWSLALVLPALKRESFAGTWRLLGQVIRYGGWAQAGNFFQLMNYRASYYFIRAFTGTAPLGVYSTGIQLSEGLWIVGRSMSMVQFARISNEDNRDYAKKLTLMFIKISFLVTSLLVLVLLALPGSFYAWIFGPGFAGVRWVMCALAAGISLLSISIVISPYFSGTGRPWVNSVGAAIGLAFTVLLSFLLVPPYGIVGAGIAASVAYGTNTLFQGIVFIKVSGVRPADLLIRREEWRLFVQAFRSSLFIKSRVSS